MSIAKEQLSDLKEKFEKAQKLIEECSAPADALEPYKNHYKARDILLELETDIERIINKTGDDSDLLVLRVIQANAIKDVGKINSFVDETGQAVEYLNKALSLLEPSQLEPEVIICYVDTLNQLGILWSKLEDSQKSTEYLVRSENASKQFKDTKKVPLTIFDLFGTSDEVEKGKGEEG